MSRLATSVGSVELPSSVLTASGTAGFGSDLGAYGNLSDLGALVTKSLAAFAWDGNPAPRVTSSGSHMINAVGLSGPGVASWRETELRELRRSGARVVGSIWGRTVEEFAEAAEAMRGADLVALEVNASCPNLESRQQIFAHSKEATSAIVEAARAAELPLWVKLSPNTPDLLAIAESALIAGAHALVLVNTVLGMSIDVENRRPSLGNGGGGISGPGILPIAVRAVFDCRKAFPEFPLVGVGGIASGEDAIAMVMAGANAVEIGTATFANPRAPWIIHREIEAWLERHDVATLQELRGAAHG